MKEYKEFKEWNERLPVPWLELCVINYGGIKRHKWVSPNGVVVFGVDKDGNIQNVWEDKEGVETQHTPGKKE